MMYTMSVIIVTTAYLPLAMNASAAVASALSWDDHDRHLSPRLVGFTFWLSWGVELGLINDAAGAFTAGTGTAGAKFTEAKNAGAVNTGTVNARAPEAGAEERIKKLLNTLPKLVSAFAYKLVAGRTSNWNVERGPAAAHSVEVFEMRPSTGVQPSSFRLR